MPKKIRRIGIYSNSPEEMSNRIFAGAQSYMKEVGGFLARDYFSRESAGNDSDVPPPWQGQIDGMIICTGRDEGKTDKDMGDWVLEGGVPAVVVGSDWHDPRFPRFHVDSRSISELAAEHLMECGCESYLHVGFSRSSGSSARAKEFQTSLARRGCASAQCAIERRCLGTTVDLPFMKAEKGLIAHLRKMKKPLGVLALNDRFAAALCLLCEELDLAIPKTVKILGTDDVALARSNQFALSSIRTPSDQVAWLAMRALHRMLDRKSVSRTPTGVPAIELFGRKSTLGKTPARVSVADSRDYIAAHACTGLTVEHLAQSMDLSRRGFELQFRSLVGHSPRDEIQRVRLERSKELLRDTLFSVSRIASMIGFAETAAFSKFFRNETGMSPRDFRSGPRRKMAKTLEN